MWIWRIGRAAGVTAILLAAAAQAAAPARKAKRAKRPKRDTQYKKFGRAAITQITEGRADAAIKALQQRLAAEPGDLECLYGLAVAHARQKEVDKALACAKKAVEAGLPIGRFHAGPRNLLKPLLDSEAFRAFAAGHAVELIHGPMLGSVTDTRARLWVRTVHEVPVQVLATPVGGAGEPIRSPVARTRAASDFTAVVEVTGLKPATRYHYELRVGGKPVAIDPRPSFRTFPRPGEPIRFEVVFGGGAGYTPKHERMWNTLAAHKPTAFLTLGDNVYIDTPKVPETQRYCYYRRQSRPEYRRFVASCPSFSIWDDHDFGTNDCLGSAGIDDPPWKMPVWRVYLENWVNPSYGGGEKQPGVWYQFAIGDVDVFMLDCRFYRVRPKGGRGTMLGPAQKKWFLDRLGKAKGTFKVLASSVPWSKGTKGGSKDTWDGFPEEREEIFSFIRENRVEGVFLISADRHRSDAYKTEREGAYPLYEASSSKLTNIHTHGLIKHALFGYNKTCSFGLLTFDTTRGDPELTYQVINIDDEPIHTLKLKRSELSFK
jgi:alkaline phosphatase D